MSYSRVDEVGSIVLDMTRKYVLTLFDPQSGMLYLPDNLLSAAVQNESMNCNEPKL
jgi:hypothetical protein